MKTYLSKSEYEAIYEELYTIKDGSIIKSNFEVDLDLDPSLNPKALSEKIALVAGLKNRLTVILNVAIRNKAYWERIVKKISSHYENEVHVALLKMDNSKKNNAEYRKAFSHVEATNKLGEKLFKGEDYETKFSEIKQLYSEASTFYNEIKNMLSNLEDTSMNLATQLKATLLNAKLYNIDGAIGG